MKRASFLGCKGPQSCRSSPAPRSKGLQVGKGRPSKQRAGNKQQAVLLGQLFLVNWRYETLLGHIRNMGAIRSTWSYKHFRVNSWRDGAYLLKYVWHNIKIHLKEVCLENAPIWFIWLWQRKNGGLLLTFRFYNRKWSFCSSERLSAFPDTIRSMETHFIHDASEFAQHNLVHIIL
jgi:hypothetical protein